MMKDIIIKTLKDVVNEIDSNKLEIDNKFDITKEYMEFKLNYPGFEDCDPKGIKKIRIYTQAHCMEYGETKFELKNELFINNCTVEKLFGMYNNLKNKLQALTNEICRAAEITTDSRSTWYTIAKQMNRESLNLLLDLYDKRKKEFDNFCKIKVSGVGDNVD